MVNFNRRINPVVPSVTTSVISNELVIATAPFTNNLATPRFVIQFDQNIPFGNVDPALLTNIDGTSALVPLIDRYGNTVRADRIYNALRMRCAGCLPYGGCNPRDFQCVLGFDPYRVTILCDLPLSSYCPTTTTVPVNPTTAATVVPVQADVNSAANTKIKSTKRDLIDLNTSVASTSEVSTI